MGKFQGFIGSGRGKVGNMVFAKGENGETVARAYQPQVANPRTAGQIEQRSKVNIAGRLSAIVPAYVISGLGMGSKRKNRSGFVSNLIGEAIADFSPAGAHIPADKVVFSRGVVPFSATAGTVTVSRSNVSIAFSDANNDGRHGERIIVLVVNSAASGNGYELCRCVDTIYSAASGTIVVPFDVTLEEGMEVNVYRIPLELDESASGVVYGAVKGKTGDYYTIDSERNSRSLVFGNSMLLNNSAAPSNRENKTKKEEK